MAGGNFSAPVVAVGAEPPLLALGVPRAQPVPQLHLRETSEVNRCLSQKQNNETPSQERDKGAEEKGFSMRP